MTVGKGARWPTSGRSFGTASMKVTSSGLARAMPLRSSIWKLWSEGTPLSVSRKLGETKLPETR